MVAIGGDILPGTFGEGGSRNFEIAAAVDALTTSVVAPLHLDINLAHARLSLDSNAIGTLQINAEQVVTLSAAVLALDSTGSFGALQPTRNLSAFDDALITSAAASLPIEYNLAATTDALITSTVAPLNVTAFSPDQVAGLVLWLEADTGLTTDGSNNVTQWVDQSTNGYIFTPPANDEPAFNAIDASLNNQPSISFDDANDEALTAPAVPIGPAPSSGGFALFVVSNLPDDTHIQTIYSEADTSDVTQRINQLDVQDNAGETLRGVWSGFNFGTSTPGSGAAVLAMVHGTHVPASGDLTINRNGSQNAQAGNIPAFSTSGHDAVWIGHRQDQPGPGIRGCEGEIAAVLAYDADLSVEDYNKIVTYLGDKYGITITLLT